MIDLHSHTNESDGTLTPAELLQAAVDGGLEALAITDHDTFAGYDAAAPLARARGFDLVCGIELSTRMQFSKGGVRTVHMLAYFLHDPPSFEFRGWLAELQAGRRERNIRLIEKLRGMGLDIELAEVEAVGRSLTGRPHFARVLIQKGYVATAEEAFRDFLGETAPGFVERDSPHLPMAAQRTIAGGGMPVIAHPIRLGFRNPEDEEASIVEMHEAGAGGIEVYHSDQGAADSARFLALAGKYGLAVSGGSDFHGANKPRISLGTGLNGNLDVPCKVLEAMRSRAAAPR